MSFSSTEVILPVVIAILFYFLQLAGRHWSRQGFTKQNDHSALGPELSTTAISLFFVLICARLKYPHIISWISDESYLGKFDFLIIAILLFILFLIWVYSILSIRSLLSLTSDQIKSIRRTTWKSNALGIISIFITFLLIFGG